jgi:Cdc6-like AAA superfamily ATPase
MRLFINYTEQDVDLVRELVELLREAGHDPWFAEDEILVGQNRQALMAQAIIYTDAFVYVLSPPALASPDCREFFQRAYRIHKPIIPVWITAGQSLPAELEAYDVFDLSEGQTRGDLQKFLQHLQLVEDNLPAAEQSAGRTVDHLARMRRTQTARAIELGQETAPGETKIPPEKLATGAYLLNDQAVGPDALGFKDYAMAFTRVISNASVRPPLTIGIYGTWGTGKTFLMHKIVDEINHLEQKQTRSWFWQRKPEEPPIRVLPIEFDAWAYNTSDVLWAGLVQEIFKRIEDQLGTFEKWSFTIKRNVAKQGRSLLRQVLYTLLFLGAIGLTLFIILNTLEFDLLAGLVPLLGLPVLVRLGTQLGTLLAQPQSRQVAAALASTTRMRNERRFLTNLVQESREQTLMVRIYEDMAKMLEAVPPNTRLAVFIDDLDRCKPDRVIEVLEAINLLLAFKEFIVFLAMDPQVIADIIEMNYYGNSTHAGVTGAEYLDKIVQIPFTIPRARSQDVINYLNKLLEAPPGEDDLWLFNRNEDAGQQSMFYDPTPNLPLTRQILAESETDEEEEASGLSMHDMELAEMEALESSQDEVNPFATPLPPNVVSFTYEERSTFRALSSYLDPNPRRIKRLINVYRLVRVLSHRQPTNIVEDDPAKVILWLLLCQQWPYATAQMLKVMLDEETTGPDNLEDAYQIVAPELDGGQRDHHRRLDFNNAMLDEIIEKYGAYIVQDDIHILQTLTVHFHPALAEELRAFMD